MVTLNETQAKVLNAFFEAYHAGLPYWQTFGEEVLEHMHDKGGIAGPEEGLEDLWAALAAAEDAGEEKATREAAA